MSTRSFTRKTLKRIDKTLESRIYANAIERASVYTRLAARTKSPNRKVALIRIGVCVQVGDDHSSTHRSQPSRIIYKTERNLSFLPMDAAEKKRGKKNPTARHSNHSRLCSAVCRYQPVPSINPPIIILSRCDFSAALHSDALIRIIFQSRN